jgi:hypothetical protein
MLLDALHENMLHCYLNVLHFPPTVSSSASTAVRNAAAGDCDFLGAVSVDTGGGNNSMVRGYHKLQTHDQYHRKELGILAKVRRFWN